MYGVHVGDSLHAWDSEEMAQMAEEAVQALQAGMQGVDGVRCMLHPGGQQHAASHALQVRHAMADADEAVRGGKAPKGPAGPALSGQLELASAPQRARAGSEVLMQPGTPQREALPRHSLPASRMRGGGGGGGGGEGVACSDAAPVAPNTAALGHLHLPAAPERTAGRHGPHGDQPHTYRDRHHHHQQSKLEEEAVHDAGADVEGAEGPAHDDDGRSSPIGGADARLPQRRPAGIPMGAAAGPSTRARSRAASSVGAAAMQAALGALYAACLRDPDSFTSSSSSSASTNDRAQVGRVSPLAELEPRVDGCAQHPDGVTHGSRASSLSSLGGDNSAARSRAGSHTDPRVWPAAVNAAGPSSCFSAFPLSSNPLFQACAASLSPQQLATLLSAFPLADNPLFATRSHASTSASTCLSTPPGGMQLGLGLGEGSGPHAASSGLDLDLDLGAGPSFSTYPLSDNPLYAALLGGGALGSSAGAGLLQATQAARSRAHSLSASTHAPGQTSLAEGGSLGLKHSSVLGLSESHATTTATAGSSGSRKGATDPGVTVSTGTGGGGGGAEGGTAAATALPALQSNPLFSLLSGALSADQWALLAEALRAEALRAQHGGEHTGGGSGGGYGLAEELADFKANLETANKALADRVGRGAESTAASALLQAQAQAQEQKQPPSCHVQHSQSPAVSQGPAGASDEAPVPAAAAAPAELVPNVDPAAGAALQPMPAFSGAQQQQDPREEHWPRGPSAPPPPPQKAEEEAGMQAGSTPGQQPGPAAAPARMPLLQLCLHVTLNGVPMRQAAAAAAGADFSTRVPHCGSCGQALATCHGKPAEANMGDSQTGMTASTCMRGARDPTVVGCQAGGASAVQSLAHMHGHGRGIDVQVHVGLSRPRRGGGGPEEEPAVQACGTHDDDGVVGEVWEELSMLRSILSPPGTAPSSPEPAAARGCTAAAPAPAGWSVARHALAGRSAPPARTFSHDGTAAEERRSQRRSAERAAYPWHRYSRYSSPGGKTLPQQPANGKDSTQRPGDAA